MVVFEEARGEPGVSGCRSSIVFLDFVSVSDSTRQAHRSNQAPPAPWLQRLKWTSGKQGGVAIDGL